MYIALSLGCGALVALMVQCNGLIQIGLGSLSALTVVHVVGLFAALLYWRLVPLGGDPDFDVSRAPWWFLSAGILGIGVVLLNMIVFAEAGILLALGGTLAGQTLTAYVVELTSWNRSGRSPVVQRLMVLLLIVPGTILIGFQSGAGTFLIFLAFVPGVILVVQSMFNSYNSSRWGHPRMLVFNYVSALLVLLPLGMITGAFRHLSLEAIGSVPPLALLGGGVLGVSVVGTITFLLKRTSPIKTFLGLYTGQLGVGVFIDTALGQEIHPAKLAGVALVALGLFSGELSRYMRRGTTEA